MKESFDKYKLSRLHYLHGDELYSPFYPDDSKDFAFEIHQGVYKDVWVLIEGVSIKSINNNMIFSYKIITNPNKLDKEDFESENFIGLVQIIVNDMFTKIWKWEEKQKETT